MLSFKGKDTRKTFFHHPSEMRRQEHFTGQADVNLMDTDKNDTMIGSVDCIVINRQYSPHFMPIRGRSKNFTRKGVRVCWNRLTRVRYGQVLNFTSLRKRIKHSSSIIE